MPIISWFCRAVSSCTNRFFGLSFSDDYSVLLIVIRRAYLKNEGGWQLLLINFLNRCAPWWRIEAEWMICMALYCKWIEKSNVVGAERAFTCSTLYLSSNDWSLNNLNNVCDGYETLYRTLLKRWHNKMKVCLMLSRKWTVHNNFRKSWVLLVDLNGWNFILCLHLFCIYLHFSNWLKFYFVFTFILHFYMFFTANTVDFALEVIGLVWLEF